MKMRKVFLAALLSLCAFSSSNAASFDCAKASTKIEKVICGSPQVSKLDSDLDAAYKAALTKSRDPEAVKAAQRAWLKGTRNPCQDETCFVTVYQQRIAALGSAVNRTQANAQTDSDAEDQAIAMADAKAKLALDAEAQKAVASAPAVVESASAPEQQHQTPTSESRPVSPSKYAGPSMWDSAESYVWSVVEIIGLVMLGGAVYAGFIKKKISLVLAIVVFVIGGVIFEAGNKKSADVPDKQFFNRAQGIEMTNLTPSADILKFGMSAKNLPKQFVLRPTTAERIKKDVDIEYSTGIPAVICYDNNEPASRVFTSESVCFDNDRLLSVVAKYSGVLTPAQLLDATTKTMGRVGERDSFADFSYTWRRTVNGVVVETHLMFVPAASVIAETLVHKHEHDKQN